MLLHEANIIATKERAEMKMIEFFIAIKLSLTAVDIQSQSAVRCEACGNRRWCWLVIRSHQPFNSHSCVIL